MPKLSDAGLTSKISLGQIVETGNIRADYNDIDDLADSIRRNGQLEPVLVKEIEPDKNGIPRYELIAGYRRLEAHKKLVSAGDDFTTIEAKIVTGKKLVIQIVENLQRSDLSPRDREKAICEISQLPGMTQKTVAAELSKSEMYVSRHITAYKARKAAENAGISTSNLETAFFEEFRKLPESEIPNLVKNAVDGGGTVAAARRVVSERKKPKQDTLPENQEAVAVDGAEPPHPLDTIEVPEIEDMERQPEPKSQEEGKTLSASRPSLLSKPDKRGQPLPRQSIAYKEIKLNDVFLEIEKYTGLMKKMLQEDPNLSNEYEKAIVQSKISAANDIIALLHRRFDN
jgi:ParB/RepB/Spo0J family partition protein